MASLSRHDFFNVKHFCRVGVSEGPFSGIHLSACMLSWHTHITFIIHCLCFSRMLLYFPWYFLKLNNYCNVISTLSWILQVLYSIEKTAYYTPLCPGSIVLIFKAFLLQKKILVFAIIVNSCFLNSSMVYL
jgi:hypothetical protein